MTDGAVQSEVKAPHNLARSALGGAGWVMGATIGKAVLHVGTMALLARMLPPAEFGFAAAALMPCSLAVLLRELWAGQALVRVHQLEPSHVATSWTVSIILGGILTATAWLAAPLYAAALRMPDLTPLLRLASPLFLLHCLSSTSRALIQRSRRHRIQALLVFTDYLVGTPLVALPCAWFGFGASALLLGELASAIVVGGVLIALHPPRGFGIDAASLRYQLNQGSGSMLGRGLNWLAQQGDVAIAGRLLGGHGLGIYSRAYQLMTSPTLLFANTVNAVLFPSMAAVQDDAKRLRNGYRRALALVALAALPASALIAILAPEMVAILLGPAWGEVVPTLQVFALGTYLRLAYMVPGTVLRSVGRVWILSVINAGYAALVLAGALVGARWGPAGIAGGVSLALLATMLAQTWVACRQTGLPMIQVAWLHRHGLALCLPVAAAALAVALPARAAGWPAALVLAAAGSAAAVAGMLCGWLVPGLFLGSDGRWLAVETWTKIRRRLGR